MYYRKNRRFRHRSNGRTYRSRDNGAENMRLPSSDFKNDRNRINFRPQQSAEKLVEKYVTLAKEAISSGDKTSSENYLQHADHFARIIEFKNLNQKQNKEQISKETKISQSQSQSSEKDPSSLNKITEEQK